MKRERAGVVAFFAILFVLDWVLYFRHAGHFFQADSILDLHDRVRSFAGFLSGFTKLHSSGWYRPLSDEPVLSLLYPWLGLNPVGYRIPVYAFFMADTVLVYALVLMISRSRLAAAIATLFFSLHTSNAYTTYDVGFLPELMYTLFYLGAALAFLHYIENGKKSARNISLLCFVASLLSKESAVTLPGVLIVLYLLVRPGSIWPAIRSTLGHVAILGVYLMFVVGYLNVQGISIAKLLHPPPKTEAGGYDVVLDGRMLQTARTSLSWAFNIPRGWWGQWSRLSPWMLKFLQLFRGLVLAGIAYLLFKPERGVILVAVAWFWLTVLPALPLVDHFTPYYMFMPVVGIALAVGVIFNWLYERLRRIQPLLGSVALLISFIGLLIVCSSEIRADIRGSAILGESSDLASMTLNDLQHLYPVIPPKTTIYIDDNEQAISWDHAQGGLIRMAYKRDDIQAQYASLGDVPGSAAATILLRVQNKHLIDETAAFRANPDPFMHMKGSDETHRLAVSVAAVTVGDHYEMSVVGAHGGPVSVMYTVDDGPVVYFSAEVDPKGHAGFDVSAETPKGLYRFIAFNIAGQSDWIRSYATIKVR